MMGVMFLVLFPLPYVDASSAWAFRNKWHRAIVGMAGMSGGTGRGLGRGHRLGPHLDRDAAHHRLQRHLRRQRLDGPVQRQPAAAVRRLLHADRPDGDPQPGPALPPVLLLPGPALRLGPQTPLEPGLHGGERFWFVFYGSTSSVYRVYISIRILLFLNSRLPEKLFLLVPILALSGIVGWLLVPVGKFLHYLATSEELARNRPRAVGSTAAVAAGPRRRAGRAAPAGPPPGRGDRGAGGAVDHPRRERWIRHELPGLAGQGRAEGRLSCVDAMNPALEAENRSLMAERRVLEVRRRQAVLKEVAAAQILDEQLAALDEKIARVQQQLSLPASDGAASGTWVSPEIEFTKGKFVRRGETLGVVANLDDLLVRATAGQNVAALLIEQAAQEVEIRVNGRPEPTITGTIEKIFPAGQEQLPSQALGYAVGGSMPVDVRDPSGTKTAEKFFEIRIRPHLDQPDQWLTGQRVVVRVPAAAQAAGGPGVPLWPAALPAEVPHLNGLRTEHYLADAGPAAGG